MSSSRSFGGISGRRRTVLPRWLATGLLVLAAFWLLAACSSSAVAPGDPAGIKSATGSHLVGMVVATDTNGQPSITAEDYAAAKRRAVRVQAGRPGRREPAGHQLHLAARDRLPGHVHAGRLRARGDGLHAGQERDAHDEHEFHDLCDRHRRLLPGGLRLRVRRPARSSVAATWGPPPQSGRRSASTSAATTGCCWAPRASRSRARPMT